MNAPQIHQHDARSAPFPIRYSIDRIIVLFIVVLLVRQAVTSVDFGASYLAWAAEFAIFALIYYAGRLSGQRRRMGQPTSN